MWAGATSLLSSTDLLVSTRQKSSLSEMLAPPSRGMTFDLECLGEEMVNTLCAVASNQPQVRRERRRRRRERCGVFVLFCGYR